MLLPNSTQVSGACFDAWALPQGDADEEALEQGMEAKSKEFPEKVSRGEQSRTSRVVSKAGQIF